jgi:hypothetical protein
VSNSPFSGIRIDGEFDLCTTAGPASDEAKRFGDAGVPPASWSPQFAAAVVARDTAACGGTIKRFCGGTRRRSISPIA